MTALSWERPPVAALVASLAGYDVIGFTGSSAGVTDAQLSAGRLLLELARLGGSTHFAHGCCIGADESFALLARDARLSPVGFPGRERGDRARSTTPNDVEYPVPAGSAPELARNRLIVAASNFLLACPGGFLPMLRSGVWATVRYALTASVPVLVVLPDGDLARAVAAPSIPARVTLATW